jgi:hypothetical protein
MFLADLEGSPTIAVATAALRREGDCWERRSGDLRRVTQMVDGMRLSRLEAGLFNALLREYTEVINVVSGRCLEGVERTAEVSNALRQVADIYDDEERRNLHSLMNLY